MASDAEILGRGDVDDIDAILAITNHDAEEAIHVVQDNADAIFTWDYEKGARPQLNKLYEKAKHAQWNGETDLDWSIESDPEKLAERMIDTRNQAMAQKGVDLSGTPVASWDRDTWTEFGMEVQKWSLS